VITVTPIGLIIIAIALLVFLWTWLGYRILP
jgi:hypothetical protein